MRENTRYFSASIYQTRLPPDPIDIVREQSGYSTWYALGGHLPLALLVIILTYSGGLLPLVAHFPLLLSVVVSGLGLLTLASYLPSRTTASLAITVSLIFASTILAFGNVGLYIGKRLGEMCNQPYYLVVENTI